MAIKAAFAAALLVALVALSSATTITVTSFDESGSQRYRQCSQHVQGQEFRACQSYLQQRQGPYVEMEEDEATTNPQSQFVRQCCEELRRMDRQECGCEAIKHAVQKAQQGGRSYQTGQSEQIYERARSLPRTCGLRQQHCRFNIVFV